MRMFRPVRQVAAPGAKSAVAVSDCILSTNAVSRRREDVVDRRRRDVSHVTLNVELRLHHDAVGNRQIKILTTNKTDVERSFPTSQ